MFATDIIVDEQCQALQLSQGSGRAARARTGCSRELIGAVNVTVQGDVCQVQCLHSMPRVSLSALDSVPKVRVRMRTCFDGQNSIAFKLGCGVILAWKCISDDHMSHLDPGWEHGHIQAGVRAVALLQGEGRQAA